MPELTAAALIEHLGAHPNRRALENLLRTSAFEAAVARRTDFASRRLASGPSTGPGHPPEGLTRADAQTAYGNVLDVLDRGVERLEEAALLGALLSLAIQSQPPAEPQDCVELGFHLVWLAAKTPCDALRSLDEALGPEAAPIWYGVALVVSAPESVPTDFGPTEALVAAAALRQSASAEAQALRFEAHDRVIDPALRALLAPTAGELGSLSGEMQASPRGPALTVFLAITLLLFVVSAVRFIGRYVFVYRRPASLRLGTRGLELSHRVELMGQVLRDRSILIPLSNLARVTREVKYARVGLYAGLLALTLGTYFGAGLFVDGIRVPGGSAPLLGLAASFIAIGLGADFVLSTGADSVRGRYRLVVVPIKGRSLCLGNLDPQQVEILLQALAEQTSLLQTTERRAPGELGTAERRAPGNLEPLPAAPSGSDVPPEATG